MTTEPNDLLSRIERKLEARKAQPREDAPERATYITTNRISPARSAFIIGTFGLGRFFTGASVSKTRRIR